MNGLLWARKIQEWVNGEQMHRHLSTSGNSSLIVKAFELANQVLEARAWNLSSKHVQQPGSDPTKEEKTSSAMEKKQAVVRKGSVWGALGRANR